VCTIIYWPFVKEYHFLHGARTEKLLKYLRGKEGGARGFFYYSAAALVGRSLLIVENSLSNSVRHTTLGRPPLDE
jgi:hypothetical protein